MPQDQVPAESAEMRTKVESLIDRGFFTPQDQVPPAAFPTYQDPVPEMAPAFQFVPDANVRHIGDAVREWTYQAVKAMAQGGRIDWDVSLGLAPSGPGSFISAYILLIYMPSIILNQEPIGTVRIIPDLPDQDQVRQAVLSAVGELKDRQNAMMNQRG